MFSSKSESAKISESSSSKMALVLAEALDVLVVVVVDVNSVFSPPFIDTDELVTVDDVVFMLDPNKSSSSSSSLMLEVFKDRLFSMLLTSSFSGLMLVSGDFDVDVDCEGAVERGSLLSTVLFAVVVVAVTPLSLYWNGSLSGKLAGADITSKGSAAVEEAVSGERGEVTDSKYGAAVCGEVAEGVSVSKSDAVAVLGFRVGGRRFSWIRARFYK